MSKILNIKPTHTGDKCFHCRKSEYWWKAQIESDMPYGIVNICLCGECVLFSADELLIPIFKDE